MQDMETLRELKLQLCRWRLEYQDAYHKGPGHSLPGLGSAWTLRGCDDDGGVADADARRLQQRFDVARLGGTGEATRHAPRLSSAFRRLVRQLWRMSELPASEAHHLLRQTVKASLPIRPVSPEPQLLSPGLARRFEFRLEGTGLSFSTLQERERLDSVVLARARARA